MSEVRGNAKNGRRHTKKKEKGPRSIIVTRNIKMIVRSVDSLFFIDKYFILLSQNDYSINIPFKTMTFISMFYLKFKLFSEISIFFIDISGFPKKFRIFS